MATPPMRLAATHALIKAGRAADAVGRARAIRAADPRAGLAYTLESHALLGLGRAEESVEMPAHAAGRRRPRPRPSRLARRLAAAQPPPRGGDPRVLRRAGAEDGRRAVALSPRHVVQGARHEGRGRRVRPHRDRARPRQQRPRGARASSPSSSARPAAGPPPTRRWPACAPPSARCADDTPVETGPFPHAVLVDDPLEQLKVARHYALHVAQLLPAAAAARRQGARRTAAHRLPLGRLPQSTRPAS